MKEGQWLMGEEWNVLHFSILCLYLFRSIGDMIVDDDDDGGMGSGFFC